MALGLAGAVLVSSCGGSTPRSSWNRHVSAHPVTATLAQILGNRTSALGGAAREGGWHGGAALSDLRRYSGRVQVGGVDQRRLVPPPSSVGGVPVFVEVDDLVVVWQSDNGRVPGTDRDTSANACGAGAPRGNSSCIHIEIDGQWKARGWAPPDFPLDTPIDIQGYIYWDIPHSDEGVPLDSAPSGFVLGHYDTGWEIHPVSAWRFHSGR